MICGGQSKYDFHRIILRMAEIDERYRMMADDPPLDLQHDRHWQKWVTR